MKINEIKNGIQFNEILNPQPKQSNLLHVKPLSQRIWFGVTELGTTLQQSANLEKWHGKVIVALAKGIVLAGYILNSLIYTVEIVVILPFFLITLVLNKSFLRCDNTRLDKFHKKLYSFLDNIVSIQTLQLECFFNGFYSNKHSVNEFLNHMTFVTSAKRGQSVHELHLFRETSAQAYTNIMRGSLKDLKIKKIPISQANFFDFLQQEPGLFNQHEDFTYIETWLLWKKFLLKNVQKLVPLNPQKKAEEIFNFDSKILDGFCHYSFMLETERLESKYLKIYHQNKVVIEENEALIKLIEDSNKVINEDLQNKIDEAFINNACALNDNYAVKDKISEYQKNNAKNPKGHNRSLRSTNLKRIRNNFLWDIHNILKSFSQLKNLIKDWRRISFYCPNSYDADLIIYQSQMESIIEDAFVALYKTPELIRLFSEQNDGAEAEIEGKENLKNLFVILQFTNYVQFKELENEIICPLNFISSEVQNCNERYVKLTKAKVSLGQLDSNERRILITRLLKENYDVRAQGLAQERAEKVHNLFKDISYLAYQLQTGNLMRKKYVHEDLLNLFQQADNANAFGTLNLFLRACKQAKKKLNLP